MEEAGKGHLQVPETPGQSRGHSYGDGPCSAIEPCGTLKRIKNRAGTTPTVQAGNHGVGCSPTLSHRPWGRPGPQPTWVLLWRS